MLVTIATYLEVKTHTRGILTVAQLSNAEIIRQEPVLSAPTQPQQGLMWFIVCNVTDQSEEKHS